METQADLRTVPLINTAELGRVVLGCSADAVESAMRRLDIEPARDSGGRRRLTFEQALMVTQEMRARARKRRAVR